MQYSPKLKKAMEEIKEIVIKHDVAAFVLLHTPGFSEYLNKIDPSYSCAFMTSDGQMRVRLKTAELPGGKEQARQIAEDTYNMASIMNDVLGMHALGYGKFHQMLKEHWGAKMVIVRILLIHLKTTNKMKNRRYLKQKPKLDYNSAKVMIDVDEKTRHISYVITSKNRAGTKLIKRIQADIDKSIS